mmetsp:Transcript_9432/g.25134  ORF Transcript_9432/g.25134 Transcript_9432/m.25134 type:complete len:239 (-) Transcript_9432:41-757(-)
MLQGRAHVLARHLPTLMPVLLATAACNQQPDLSNAAKSCAVLLAHAPLSSTLLDGLMPQLQRVVRGGSWHLRGSLIIPTQLLAFRGQFCDGAARHREGFRGLLQTLMSDTQQEVREAACAVVSGFVRLHGAPERVTTLQWAHDHARRAAPPAERHGGVLALSSLVMLAPYDVPAWLPEVLELLASFFREPQPIKRTVTKTFADFKRTHQDNWAAHKARFTPEQQEIITDMLDPPSFYA